MSSKSVKRKCQERLSNKCVKKPARGLLRVPQLWARVEVTNRFRLLLPWSFMRFGLLVATAKSLPGSAFCASSAHTDEHATGLCAMAWLNTEGSWCSQSMCRGGSENPIDNYRLHERNWSQYPLHLAYATWRGMPRKHWSMTFHLNRLTCWPYRRRNGVSRQPGAPPNGISPTRRASKLPFCCWYVFILHQPID